MIYMFVSCNFDIIIFSFFVITFIFYRYTKIQKEYKQRFREILVEKKQNKPIEKNVFKENTQIHFLFRGNIVCIF